MARAGRATVGAARRRRWRRGRTSGVSEIVAVLLVSAMAIILAAILYVLIAGIVHGGSEAPSIGTAFAAGVTTVGNQVGTGGATTCGLTTTTASSAIAAGDWVYTLSVQSSSVSLGDVLFQVRNATGSLDTSAVGFFVINNAGQVVACAGTTAAPVRGSMSATLPFVYPTAGGASGGTPLTYSDTLLLEMGGVNPDGAGFTFTVLGQGAFSGATSPLPLH